MNREEMLAVGEPPTPLSHAECSRCIVVLSARLRDEMLRMTVDDEHLQKRSLRGIHDIATKLGNTVRLAHLNMSGPTWLSETSFAEDQKVLREEMFGL